MPVASKPISTDLLTKLGLSMWDERKPGKRKAALAEVMWCKEGSAIPRF